METNLEQNDWQKQLENDDNAVVLDVRTVAELNQGVIGNPVHLDFFEGENFVKKLDELDKSKNYYVYCRSGNRSGKACAIMNQLGFNNAYNLTGGISEWQGGISPYYD